LEINLQSVGAVVVSYNRRALLEQVLNSLLTQSRPIDHIYVVDNASTDGTADFLSSLEDSKISWKRLPRNTGGSGGFSFGMKWAFEEGHEWIWLMDDDVMQAPSCLEELLRFGKTHRVLIPMPMGDDGGHLAGLAMKLNLDSPFRRGFKSHIVDRIYPTVRDLPSLIPIEDLSFEGPLIHRSIPEIIGFPRNDFFIGWDDTEFAVRILRAKLGPSMLVREAHMLRLAKQSTSLPLWRRYYQWRNELLTRTTSSKSTIMRMRVWLMFIVRTVWGCISRSMSYEETKARMNAFIDSFAGELPNRYLPGVPPRS
jgi:GT2 family glycosyltransferase